MTDAEKQLSRAARIEVLINKRFTPAAFELIDDSSRHAGHAGARPGGETHYTLRLISPVFEGLTRVARQRLVYEALREEFDMGLHALAMELKTPAEA